MRASNALNARLSRAAKLKRAAEVYEANKEAREGAAELKAAEAVEEARDVEILDAPTREIVAEVVEEIAAEKEADHQRLVAGMEELERRQEATVDEFVTGLTESDQDRFLAQMKSENAEWKSKVDELESKCADLESENEALKQAAVEHMDALKAMAADFKQQKEELLATRVTFDEWQQRAADRLFERLRAGGSRLVTT